MPSTETIARVQAQSLDDTDQYASVWQTILDRQRQEQSLDENYSMNNLWGGRGRGGRGLARRTVQPTTIVIDDIRLQYLQDGATYNEGGSQNMLKQGKMKKTQGGGQQTMLLDRATLKLLPGRVYGMIGRNGSGKSTLLQRMNQQKLPGWSVQWSSLYVPPCLSSEHLSLTPMELFRMKHDECHRTSRSATKSKIRQLETQLEDLDVQEDPDATERLCGRISVLEEQLEPTEDGDDDVKTFQRMLEDDFQIDTRQPCSKLSLGQQKEVLLSVASICCQYTTLLLLDEPASDLGIPGLLRLRGMLASVTCTVVMVSHDVDLLNDVSTDIIELKAGKLSYFPGNYDSYRFMKEQIQTHQMKQTLAVEKKRDRLFNTLQHLKEQPTPRRGGAKKKAKAVAAHRKKMEWHEKGVSDKSSSLDDVLLPEKKGLSAAQRVYLAQVLKSVPDKAVQFVFPSIPSQWNEPLVVAYDVGYEDPNKGSDKTGRSLLVEEEDGTAERILDNSDIPVFQVVKRDGFLFDCVDMCIEEGSMNCILGPTSLSSYLLKILAKKLNPTEGTVHHAIGIDVGYLDSAMVGQVKDRVESTETTALNFLKEKFPGKTHEELRAHLTSFGMSSTSQTKTPLCCLSGGETFRFALASEMLRKPPVLCLDSPTSHLDVESVHALAYGLQQWNGTLMMVCHDASFLRSLDDVKCVVIVPEEGKVRRIVRETGMGSIDSYLKSLQ